MSEPSTSVVRSLFVTLKRSFAGTPHFHKRVLTAMGLSTVHQCVEKPNNSSIRGMLMKVPHMVIIQTDRMFYLQSMKQYHERLPRPPLHVLHGAPLSAALRASPGRAASAAATAASEGTSAPATASTVRRTKFEQTLLAEHVLPQGMEGYQRAALRQPPSQHVVEQMRRRRVEVLNKFGIWSPQVKRLNEQFTNAKPHAVRRGRR